MMDNITRYRLTLDSVYRIVQGLPKDDWNEFWRMLYNEKDEIGELARLKNLPLYEKEPESVFQCGCRLNQLQNIKKKLFDSRWIVLRLLPGMSMETINMNQSTYDIVKDVVFTMIKEGCQNKESGFVFVLLLFTIGGQIHGEITKLNDMLPPEQQQEITSNFINPSEQIQEEGTAHITPWLINLVGDEAEAQKIVKKINIELSKTKQPSKTVIKIFKEIKGFSLFPVDTDLTKLARHLTECAGVDISRQNLSTYRNPKNTNR